AHLFIAEADNRAGGTDRVVPKMDGSFGGKPAEAMVVQYFEDGDFVGAGDGLGEFVVIHQDQFARDGLDEIAFGEDSGQDAVFAEDGENKGSGAGGSLAGDLQRRIGSKAGEGFDHPPHPDSAAGQQHGGGRVVGRTDDHDPRLASGLGDGHGSGQAASDDNGADFGPDGAPLNFFSVADEKDDLIG